MRISHQPITLVHGASYSVIPRGEAKPIPTVCLFLDPKKFKATIKQRYPDVPEKPCFMYKDKVKGEYKYVLLGDVAFMARLGGKHVKR
ncbi:MAG: hypothetical protein Unbinned4162contig1001_36 [Prokaryotic dsDNA virus sp.]|nr:MAG: hypothetical protein Unbinned4162contig1001_36 [Prokaryotic dsDNA virus sp.]